MNDESFTPACKHTTQGIAGVHSLGAPPYECGFCERDRLAAENAELRKTLSAYEETEHQFHAAERPVRTELRLAKVENAELRREVERLRVIVSASHWGDCATNHGGSACDKGEECGDAPEDRAYRRAQLAQLSALTADRERMQPVYEAAKAWHFARQPGSHAYVCIAAIEDALYDAIDAALAATKGAGE